MPHVDDGTLHALLDGALRANAPDRADAVEAHLAACDDCRARLEAAAAVRRDAGAVLEALDAGFETDAAAGEAAARPDFHEVLTRAGALAGADAGPDADAPDDLAARRAAVSRRYRWTRGVAWAATIVIALGTGYIVRDLAGPTGEVPRAEQPAAGAADGAADDATAAGDLPPAVEEAPDAAGGGETGAGPVAGARAEDVAPGEAAPGAEPEVLPEAPLEAAPDELADELAEMPPPEAALRGSAAAAPAPSLAAPVAAGEEDRAARMAPAEAAMPSAFADDAARRARGPDDPQIVVVGCYVLDPIDWSRPVGGMHIPPPRFELLDSIGTSGAERGRLLLRPVIEAQSRNPKAYWAPVSPDSVHVTWHNGFGGARLMLEVGGDRLTGTAQLLTDAFVMDSTGEWQEPITADAHAVRIPCQDEVGRS